VSVRRSARPSALAATLIVSGAAAASRVLGFLRDVLIAAALGAGPVADAFLVALRLPNLARRTLAEGALTAGFAPLHARVAAEEGETAAARLAGEALGALALVLSGLVALGMLAAGGLVLVVAAGLAGEEASRTLAAELTRLALPAIAAFGLAGLASAVLAARERVVALALAPLASNATMIAVLLLAPARIPDDPERLAAVLAASVGLAGVVQLAVVLLALRRAGGLVAVRPRLGPRTRAALVGLLPALVAVANVELILLAATQVASFTPGAVAQLYYAERLVQLPLGLVAAAAAAVLLPRIASRHRAGDAEGFVAAQNRALELAALVACPAAAALVMLDEAIVAVLFGRGAFTQADVAATAAILTGLAVGLPIAAAGKILQQGGFARERPRTALIATGLGVAATLAAGAALAPALGPLGIGLAASGGLAAHALVLAVVARRVEGWAPDIRLGDRFPRIVVATGAMAAWLLLLDGAGLAATVGEAGALAISCLTGAAVYAATALAAKAVQPADLAAFR